MAEENVVMAEVLNLLEAEPAAALPAPGPDIPALREDLAILVSSGRCKEAIGTNLTHEQVRRLEEKDVMKYSKRYEAYVGARTTEALKKELKNDYIISKELSTLSGSLALRCDRFLALANSVLISAKHVGFEPHHPSRDSDGYPLAGQDEVGADKQTSANAE